MSDALLNEPRPIATAPRDGTKFWGMVGQDAIAMFWHPEFEAFVSSFRRMELAEGLQFEGGAKHRDHSPVVHTPEWWLPLRTAAARMVRRES